VIAAMDGMSATDVVVTGAGGYIGRHVVAASLAAGVPTTAVVRSAERAELPAHPLLTVLECDILDAGATGEGPLREALSRASTVIHLAWRDGFVLGSPAHMADLSAHARFIARLRELSVPRIAVAGTMHEVGYWEGAVDDSTPTNPQNQYGIAKDALRRSLLAPPALGDSEIVWFRMFYIYGDDSRSNSIFAKLKAAADRGDTTFPFTSGKNRYDFIHVDELGRQILAVATTPGITGVVNCSSGRAVPLGDRVQGFIEEEGLAITLNYGAFPDRPTDSPAIWGDASIALAAAQHMNASTEKETP
jgi:nucleoside-diphosphate-sugar epimerase